jgi:DNA-binding NtrC family response regulator
VRPKRFREDLYYRLDVLTVRAPALRERPDDVPAAGRPLRRGRGRLRGPRSLTLSRAARTALRHAEWPGNVRQLSAAVQRGARREAHSP